MTSIILWFKLLVFYYFIIYFFWVWKQKQFLFIIELRFKFLSIMFTAYIAMEKNCLCRKMWKKCVSGRYFWGFLFSYFWTRIIASSSRWACLSCVIMGLKAMHVLWYFVFNPLFVPAVNLSNTILTNPFLFATNGFYMFLLRLCVVSENWMHTALLKHADIKEMVRKGLTEII